ncbi:hypothetical protein ACFQAT_26915 [Undibacterium arcticum]|uniref:Uncharacterized protein n=1 Tax=Undibacterium arcticum TaxID=1762892 RepID=A0ABV7EVC5_9BURK
MITFSHVVARDVPKGKGAESFKKLEEKATKGHVKVNVFPNRRLYEDNEEPKGLQLDSCAPALHAYSKSLLHLDK